MKHLPPDSERVTVAQLVAGLRQDLEAIGGFENGLVSVPAEGVRHYIVRLENALRAETREKLRRHAGQRVEVLLHRGEADAFYRGTVLDDGRVLLDDGYPYGAPPGPAVVETADIADWRPL